MKKNITKQLILKTLYNNKILIKGDSKVVSGNTIGLSIKEISGKLNVKEFKVLESLTELIISKEIEDYELDLITNYRITTKNGYFSFFGQKYKYRNNNLILGYLKDFVQIVIPVLALFISIYVVTKKDSTLEKEIQTLILHIEQQEKRIEIIEMNLKNLP